MPGMIGHLSVSKEDDEAVKIGSRIHGNVLIVGFVK